MYITDIQGNQELLTDFLNDSVVVRRNLEGKYELDFTIVRTQTNRFAYDLVQDFSVVTLNNENFVIRVLKELNGTKQVNCVHEFYDLIDETIDGYLPDGLTTIQTCLNFVFPVRLGWTVNLTGTFAPALLNQFGNKNVIALLNTIREQFNCEYIFSSTNRVINISNRIGVDTEFQVRNGHNLVTLERNVDSTDVKTAIRVNYNPVDGVYRNSVTYISPLASRYPRIRYADPINYDTTNRTVAESYGALQINDSPTISIRLEFSQLRANGYTSNDLVVGNTFFLIDERINENSAVRIIEVEYYPLSNRSPVVSVSNRPKYYTDIGIRQRQLQTIFLDQLTRLNEESIRKGENLDGVVLTEENGLQVNASGRGVVITMNSNDGFLIENNGVRKFYVDTSGNVTFDGRLNITNSAGNTTLLNAFMDSRGGLLEIYNNTGSLNATLGSASAGGVSGGGNLSLYSDSGGETVSLSANAPNAFSGNAGRLMLTGGGTIEVNSGRMGGVIQVSNGSDNTEMLPDNFYVNGNRVATEQFVIDYIASRS